MEREALKLALEVLEDLPGFRADIDNAIAAIKEVLAQPAREPVGGTREAFEKWAKTFPNYIDITRFENGYSDSDTNYAWIAWQAALAQPAQELAIGDIQALKHRIHELEGEVIGYKRILDAQPAQERIGFAGVKIWVGNQQVVKLLTRIELDHAIDPWLHVKLNADMCIATLLKRMSK